MRTTRSRSLAALAAGALLLGPLAGCGSDDKTSGAAAGPTSTSSPSPSASASASESATPEPTSDALSTEGAAAPGERLTEDNLVPTMLAAMHAKKTAHMKMEIGTSIGAEADVRYSGDRTDMKMTMDMGPSKVVVIMVDGVLYIQQGADATFMKVDRNDGALGSLLDQMSGLGPESSVSAMRGSVRKVEYVGPETVDGTSVSKYRVTVDSSSVAKTLGLGAAGSSLPKRVSYDLYVDADNLLRRIDMDVDGQQITMTVSRWGEPVAIAAPPASQVAPR